MRLTVVISIPVVRVLEDLIKMLTYLEARHMFQQAYWSGRNKGKLAVNKFPFGQRYICTMFRYVEVPLDLLESKTSQPEIVPNYMLAIKAGDSFPPIFISMGRLLRDGKICKFDKIKICDGNHRVQAAKNLGQKTITALIPHSHMEAYDESNT